HEVQKNHLAEWGRIEDKVEQEVTERTEKGVDNLLRALEERLQLFLAKLLDERATQGPNAVGLGAGVDNPGQDRGGNHLIVERQFDFQNGSWIERVITQQIHATPRYVLNLSRPSKLLAAGLGLRNARPRGFR